VAIFSYNWHPQSKKWRYVFAFIFVGIAVVVWLAMRGEKDWTPRLICFAVGLASLCLFVEQEARIDAQAGVMIREGRLLGRVLVWRWRDRLADFVEVGFSRSQDAEGNDTIFVGLRRRSGRLAVIQYFCVATGTPCYQAEMAGRSLAEATGLKLCEEAV
jgi:hypothetical protein